MTCAQRVTLTNVVLYFFYSNIISRVTSTWGVIHEHNTRFGNSAGICIRKTALLLPIVLCWPVFIPGIHQPLKIFVATFRIPTLENDC